MTPHAHRFMSQPGNQVAVDAQHHPYGTPDTPMVMPMVLVEVGPDGMAMQDMAPLITANGAMIPATAPHTWFNVHAAGGP